jgi:hypothetical protein
MKEDKEGEKAETGGEHVDSSTEGKGQDSVEVRPLSKFKRRVGNNLRGGAKAKEDNWSAGRSGRNLPWCTQVCTRACTATTDCETVSFCRIPRNDALVSGHALIVCHLSLRTMNPVAPNSLINKLFNVQFDFDPRYAKISETRVKEAAETGNFSLVSHKLSTLAGGKSVVLYFATVEEAERAVKELPSIIRRQEQKASSYSIHATVLKYYEAQNIIKSAKELRELREREQKQSHAASGGGSATTEMQPHVATSVAENALAQPQLQPQPQPHQVVFLQPHSGASYTAPGFIHAPAGFLPIAAAPGGVMHGREGVPAIAYPQAFASVPPNCAPLHSAPQYTFMEQARMPVAPAAQAAPVVDASFAMSPLGVDLNAILVAAGDTGVSSGAGGDMLMGGGQASASAEEVPRTEEGFLSVLESLRGGVTHT